MLLDYSQQLSKLTERRIKLANKYAQERKNYGETKSEIDILYAAKILSLLTKKKNLGYETGLIMLIAEERESGVVVLGEMYKKMITHFNNYKAIERMIDAIESKITSIQSIMRYNRENEGVQYGKGNFSKSGD